MYSRKLALALAKRYRTCPPAGLRKALTFKEEWAAHLDICPYCSDESREQDDDWEILWGKLKKFAAEERKALFDTEIQPGQLRFIGKGGGEWRGRLCYNPPIILVKQNVQAISDDLLVYQTYHDITLAGPGDLIVPDKYSPIGAFFVETWNSYTLKGSSLAPVVGSVAPDILRAAEKYEESLDDYPDWALLPPPLTENDPRNYFRELEVEVGYAFSSEAAFQLMDQFERPRLKMVYSSPGQVMAAIREKVPRIRWEKNPTTVKEAFSMACFPPEELALAARESDGKMLPANLVLISGGAIKEFMPVRLELFSEQVLPDCLEISGQMLDMPEGIDFSGALMVLNNRESDELQWDSNTGYLFARFHGAGKITGETPVAIVLELS